MCDPISTVVVRAEHACYVAGECVVQVPCKQQMVNELRWLT